MSIELLEQIIAEQPKFHHGETEMKHFDDGQQSFLDRQSLAKLVSNAPACYGIHADVARFIYATVNERSKTLEIGAGISTLCFAIKHSLHTTVTPNESETLAIKEYAASKKISISNVEFVVESSEKYLPNCTLENLDLVLLDGKHAFPWPFIDWFYTADKLKKGGFMIVDDVQLHSVSLLRDYLLEDPHWKLVNSFSERTFVFQKIKENVRDVAWHMQPFVVSRTIKHRNLKNILQRLLGLLTKKLK